MKTAKEYKDSLRDRKIKVYLKGELLDMLRSLPSAFLSLCSCLLSSISLNGIRTPLS